MKKSYQKLLRIFDLLEDSLLPGRKEKKLHQQREASKIVEVNQQLLQNKINNKLTSEWSNYDNCIA